MLEQNKSTKIGKIFTGCSDTRSRAWSNKSGKIACCSLFARVEIGVTKFSPKPSPAILAWFFSFFLAGSLVVCESLDRFDKILEKNVWKKPFWPELFQQKPDGKSSSPVDFFFWPQKSQLWGWGVWHQSCLASSIDLGAHTSMPRPFFGAKAVCYVIEIIK